MRQPHRKQLLAAALLLTHLPVSVLSEEVVENPIHTISRLKYRWNPFSARDAFNDSRGQIFDCKT